MTQEIEVIDFEADIRVRWEAVHSIKGQLTKSYLYDLKRITQCQLNTL